MNPKLTLGQRLMADTPDFFKKVHYFGLVIVLVTAVLATYFHLPAEVIAPIGSFGTAIAVLAPFAVKDIQAVSAVLQANGSLPDAFFQLIPELISQLAQVKEVLGKPVNNSIPDAINNIRDAVAGDAATTLTVVKD